MEQNLSWKRAYGASILLHLVLFLLLALGLAQIVAENEQQTYVVDLAASDFSQGSGQTGGGSAGTDFPEPLKAEEVAKRVETVQQEQTLLKAVEAVQTPSPDAPVLPAATQSTPADNAAPAASSAQSVGGTSQGIGDGTGSGSGAGVGDSSGEGRGTGEGTGEGEGDGDVPGAGSIPFDAAGFRAAVEANKTYPHTAIMRRLEGATTISCTINTNGTIVDVSTAGSSGFDVLDKAAVAAARAVGSYPNPTGRTISVTITVYFHLNR